MKRKYLYRLVLLTGWLAVLVVSSLKAQPSSAPVLIVDGEVETPLKLTITDLGRLEQASGMAKDHDGQLRNYKGVTLFNILKAAGVTLGGQLRGKNLLKYVEVKAIDGYQVIFSLPEIDPEFTDQMVLVAYEMDGKPLKDGDGPFRFVVPADKKHARWIREVSNITVKVSR